MARRPEKKTLSTRIILIVGILVVAGVFQLIWGLSVVRYYNRQNDQMESNIGEAFLTERDSMFDYLNADLQTMLYDGAEVRKVEEAYGHDSGTPGDVFRKTNAVMAVKNKFQRMADAYGTELKFFYHDPQTGQTIDFGEQDISARQEFVDQILEDIEDGTLPLTRSGKWQLYQGKYLCLVVRGMHGIAGCFLTAEHFTEQLMRLVPEGSAKVELFDGGSGYTFVREQGRDGSIQCYVTEEAPEEGNFRSMKYAEFQVCIRIMQDVLTAPILLQMLFTVFFVIYLLIVVFVLIYTKKSIFGQVSNFRDNLLRFADSMQFKEESGIVEFAEAGKVMNQLAEEINRLKIDVYEQQLLRQQVELDYAQLQIRPHFFTNCLSVIHSFAEMGKIKDIQQLTMVVSNYLRGKFRKSMKPVSLQEELRFVENYLQVFGCMNGVRCKLKLSVTDGLEDFLVPPLLIQTFVENALKHGLGEEDDFQVWITAERQQTEEGSLVQIVIKDSGTGMSQEICRLWNQGSFINEDERYHVGVKNAVQRMELIYGKNAGIHFASQPGDGLTVTIFFREDSQKEEPHEDIVGG